MSLTKTSASRQLWPLILTLTSILAPLALASAQTVPEPSDTPEVEGSVSTKDVGAKAHHKGKGGCGRCSHASFSDDSRGKGHGCGGQHKGAKGSGPKGHGRAEMHSAHLLVTNHEQLERSIEDIPNGVQTITTTEDPELREVLREHVQEMSAALEGDGHVRRWDPLFAEIFEHRESIRIDIEEIDDGVRVVETSEDEEVVKLIRAHARKVDEFVARGHGACREETPLPTDYEGR